MNQAHYHYDVFYTANKGALVSMLMRALEEISALNQENDDQDLAIRGYIEASAELREELSQADAANAHLNTRIRELQEVNSHDRETMHREHKQRTELLVAFVVKRPTPSVFRELFGAPTWLLVNDAVRNDKKILAIKHLRAHSGLGVYDAKKCIDALIESRAPRPELY